jgi:hypothetical protein
MEDMAPETELEVDTATLDEIEAPSTEDVVVEKVLETTELVITLEAVPDDSKLDDVDSVAVDVETDAIFHINRGVTLYY